MAKLRLFLRVSLILLFTSLFFSCADLLNGLFGFEKPAFSANTVHVISVNQNIRIKDSSNSSYQKDYHVPKGKLFKFPDPDELFDHKGYNFSYYSSDYGTTQYHAGEQIYIEKEMTFHVYWQAVQYHITYYQTNCNTVAGELVSSRDEYGNYPDYYSLDENTFVSNLYSSNEKFVFDQWAVYYPSQGDYYYFQHYFKMNRDSVLFERDEWTNSSVDGSFTYLTIRKKTIVEEDEEGHAQQMISDGAYLSNDYIPYSYDSLFNHIEPGDIILVPLWRYIEDVTVITDETGDNPADNPSDNPTDNPTDNPPAGTSVNVLYCLNNNNAETTVSHYSTQNSVTNLLVPEWDGYTFNGWYEEGNGLVSEIAAGRTGDVCLEANWSVNQYYIVYPDSEKKYGLL